MQFRAHILAERMGEFRAAVQAAGGRDKVFGSDVFPASTGLLGGHWYGKWEQATDFLTGGSSHGGVVGWATGVTNLAREWTAALCRHAQGLDESEVLALVWRMFGVEDLDLPETAAGVAEGPLPIAAPVRAGSGSLKSADQWDGAAVSAPLSGLLSAPRTGAGFGGGGGRARVRRMFVYGQCRGRGAGAGIGGGFGGSGVIWRYRTIAFFNY